MLTLPVRFDFDKAVEKERKKGLLTNERIVWKKVTWWPYLDCVLNMEPYHTNRRVAIALAVDWVGVEDAQRTTHFDNQVRMLNLVGALLATSPIEGELKEVSGVPTQDLIVPQNFSLIDSEKTFTLLSEALRGCRDVLVAMRYGARVIMGLDDSRTRSLQAVEGARAAVEELMMPEGYEHEMKTPDERKVVGITSESLLANGSLRDKGLWMIQSQRLFWMPVLVVHYGGFDPHSPYWRVVKYDRDGRKVWDKSPQWEFPPWVAQLKEHQALDGTVSYLGGEFWRLDKERTSGKDKAEKDAATVKEREVLDKLDGLLPRYKEYDRKFRFDLFCSASMLCLSMDEYSRGLGYAKAALELAPNDGRPHISWALNAVHLNENREEAVRSCLKGVQLPPVSGDAKTASSSLKLMKLELEQERDSVLLTKLVEGVRRLYPTVAEELFGESSRSRLEPPA